MHWSLGLIAVVVVAFLAGAWYCKAYPNTIPYVT